MSPLVLVTSSPEKAVWLSFAFYLLNLLVPIIPAVIIYWLFPEGKTKPGEGSSIEGNVAGWKIKAVGAFGAYVTAFVLGLVAIQSTAVPLIKKVGGASVWTIDSNFKFLDDQGKEIKQMTTDKLIVEPPMVQPWGQQATIKIFSETLDPPDNIHVKMDGYNPAIVPLPKKPPEDGKIKLTDPITLTRLPDIQAGPGPTPLPATSGPAPVTGPTPPPTH